MRSQAPLEQAVGFATELWTVKRVRSVIEREFGVQYSQTDCWELLRDMGSSPQKPDKRATQRNEQAIAQWKAKTWPGLKHERAARAEPTPSWTSPGCRRLISACGAARCCLAVGRPRLRCRAWRACRPRASRA